MIRVLIVDDSPTVRRHLRTLLSAEPDFDVVGEAEAGELAAAELERLRPDLVSLDVFMPRWSAAQTVRQMLSARPVPIVLVSDAPEDSAEVFEALAAGALDFVPKPRAGDASASSWLVQTFRALSRVRVRRRPVPALAAETPTRLKVVAIGSSAGGPSALRELLGALPRGFPAPVLVAQHLAPGFEDGLVSWLSAQSPLEVKLGVDGEPLRPGVTFVGRPGTDITVSPKGRIVLTPAPVRGYHPSANALFSSIAATFPGGAASVVVLSGIGEDGTLGAKDIADGGGDVLAQDRRSCAVYGMPASVKRSGLAKVTGSPLELAQWLRARAGTSETPVSRP